MRLRVLIIPGTYSMYVCLDLDEIFLKSPFFGAPLLRRSSAWKSVPKGCGVCYVVPARALLFFEDIVNSFRTAAPV